MVAQSRDLIRNPALVGDNWDRGLAVVLSGPKADRAHHRERGPADLGHTEAGRQDLFGFSPHFSNAGMRCVPAQRRELATRRE